MNIRKSILAVIVFSLYSSFALAQPVSKSGIALDATWKVAVYEFAKENLAHTAWGVAHYERNYLLGLELAEADSLQIDDDVLFAAAFLHDMGVFEPYVIADAEHSQTATENIESVLNTTDFPIGKIIDVKTAILAHMFYADVPDNNTAIVLHDADTLDFLGIIGVTRILSLSTRHPWASDLQTAVATLENFSEQLPASLKTQAAKTMAETRVVEMRNFLETLKKQSNQGATL
ncbi:MAG: hypothetical protein ACJAY7_000612 [Pseudohongiellaceae bacterium]|jgi:uncharacterized protein